MIIGTRTAGISGSNLVAGQDSARCKGFFLIEDFCLKDSERNCLWKQYDRPISALDLGLTEKYRRLPYS